MEQISSHKDIVVVYYDGWCKLCAGIVDKVLAFDKKGQILMVPFQEKGKVANAAKVSCSELKSGTMDEVLVVKAEKTFTGAEGVIEVLKTLGGLARFIGLALSVLPNFILNAVYVFIARYRYRIFGKVQCELS